jgi:hypothetical protein
MVEQMKRLKRQLNEQKIAGHEKIENSINKMHSKYFSVARANFLKEVKAKIPKMLIGKIVETDRYGSNFGGKTPSPVKSVNKIEEVDDYGGTDVIVSVTLENGEKRDIKYNLYSWMS